MSETTFVLARDNKTALDLIRFERKTSRIRYAAYIADNSVTKETVAVHVQALANLAGEVTKWESGAERKAFCTKVRNGLNDNLDRIAGEGKYAPADETAPSDETATDETGADETDETGETTPSAPATDPLDVLRRAVVAAREAGLDEVAIREAVAAALV